MFFFLTMEENNPLGLFVCVPKDILKLIFNTCFLEPFFVVKLCTELSKSMKERFFSSTKALEDFRRDMYEAHYWLIATKKQREAHDEKVNNKRLKLGPKAHLMKPSPFDDSAYQICVSCLKTIHKRNRHHFEKCSKFSHNELINIGKVPQPITKCTIKCQLVKMLYVTTSLLSFIIVFIL